MRGGVFFNELSGDRAAAELSVEGDRIVAQTSDGRSAEVATRDCTLSLGGASGRVWFVRSADATLTLFSEDEAFHAAVARHPVLGPRAAQVRAALVEEAKRNRVRWVVGIAVAIALLCGAYFGTVALAHAAVRALPASVDVQLGDLAAESMDLGGPKVKLPAVVDPVQHIVDRLAPHADADGFEFDVVVVRSPTVNAFALPGGRIVVFTGLLQTAEAPRQVAGVLAHEMAHVTLRHGLQRMAQGLGVAAVVEVLLGDMAGLSALVLEMARAGALTSYGRDQEREADARGVRTLHAAGIVPVAMAEFFERMQAQQGSSADVAVPQWLSSHPDHAERSAAVRRLAGELGPLQPAPLSLDWAALQSHLADTQDLNTEAPAGQDAAEAPAQPYAN